MGVSITYTSDQSGATVDPQDVVRVHGKVYSTWSARVPALVRAVVPDATRC